MRSFDVGALSACGRGQVESGWSARREGYAVAAPHESPAASCGAVVHLTCVVRHAREASSERQTERQTMKQKQILLSWLNLLCKLLPTRCHAMLICGSVAHSAYAGHRRMLAARHRRSGRRTPPEFGTRACCVRLRAWAHDIRALTLDCSRSVGALLTSQQAAPWCGCGQARMWAV